jgi:hypothetical protein
MKKTFQAFSKILYPDKVKQMLSSVEFPDTATSLYSEYQLNSLSWLGHNVITLVTDENPEIVLASFELVQSLNGCIIKAPLNDEDILHTKNVEIRLTFLLVDVGNNTHFPIEVLNVSQHFLFEVYPSLKFLSAMRLVTSS